MTLTIGESIGPTGEQFLVVTMLKNSLNICLYVRYKIIVKTFNFRLLFLLRSRAPKLPQMSPRSLLVDPIPLYLTVSVLFWFSYLVLHSRIMCSSFTYSQEAHCNRTYVTLTVRSVARTDSKSSSSHHEYGTCNVQIKANLFI